MLQPGGLYHVYNIGNNRETIFKEDANYHYFLRRLKYYTDAFVIIHAYCLMPNHFHLLIEIPLDKEEHTIPWGESKLSNIQRAFKNFFTSYAKAINKAYDRLGSLFKTRCQFKPISSHHQYRTTVAYIHYNPVKAKLCKSFNDWSYSSFNDFMTSEKLIADTARTLQEFGGLEEFLNFHQFYRQLKNSDQLLLA